MKKKEVNFSGGFQQRTHSLTKEINVKKIRKQQNGVK
jgi:hypothetical protein